MTRTSRPLPAKFYNRDAADVARDLLGCILESRVRGAKTSGRIVEVEAYLGAEDPAAHTYGGRRTERTEPMFGKPGTTYVYFTYGMHWCMNAVTGPVDHASAVLIRALEPIEGIETMARRRSTRTKRNLCSGPAKLCQALGLDGRLNFHPLQVVPLQIKGPAEHHVEVCHGAEDWNLTGQRLAVTLYGSRLAVAVEVTHPATFSCSTVLLFNCSIVQLFYCSIVLLFSCSVVQLFSCSVVQLFSCSIVQLFNCSTVLLFSCSTVLLGPRGGDRFFARGKSETKPALYHVVTARDEEVTGGRLELVLSKHDPFVQPPPLQSTT